MRFLIKGVALMLLFAVMIGVTLPLEQRSALLPAAPDATFRMTGAEQARERAQILAKSYYRQFYSPVLHRLSFHPFSTRNASCWEYIGLLSLTYKLALSDAAHLKKMDGILQGLRHYRKEENGSFAGYVVDRHPQKDRTESNGIAYDDNMWLGRDFVALYELTKDKKYLELAIEIGDDIIKNAYVSLPAALFEAKGWQVKQAPVGGFYWDYRCDAVHTCSTGPAAQFLAALHRVTGEEIYLTHAKAAYEFLSYLENDDGVFHDLMRFEKDSENNIAAIAEPDRKAYAYNSGSPITAAVELYRITGEERYLSDAKHWASAADRFFAQDSDAGVKEYPVDTTTWFNLILLNGYAALLPYWAEASVYIQNIRGSIDYAYENYRTQGAGPVHKNVLPRGWVQGFAGETDFQAIALDVSAAAEIYATMAVLNLG